MEINKQDKVHHETEVCEYRRVKCHDCGKMQEVVGRLEGKIMEMNRKLEEVKRETMKEVRNAAKNTSDKVEAMNEEMKTASTQTEKVKKEVGEVKEEVGEVKKEVKDVKENLSKVNKDVDEIKVMMSEVLEKLNMLEHLNKLPSPTERLLNTPREDILIASGCFETGTEIFSWEKNGWFEVSPINEEHHYASSFIYKDQLFVVGGI